MAASAKTRACTILRRIVTVVGKHGATRTTGRIYFANHTDSKLHNIYLDGALQTPKFEEGALEENDRSSGAEGGYSRGSGRATAPVCVFVCVCVCVCVVCFGCRFRVG
jgi:hypothetical protein